MSRTQLSTERACPEGLPERLPPGEHLLWQGRPSARVLAMRVFNAGYLALYFGVIIAWCAGSALWHGQALGHVALFTAKLCGVASVPLLVIAAYAWLTTLNTVYTITNRRVAMRIGVALPATLNLPLRSIESADLHLRAGGNGDLALSVVAGKRLNYLVLWPHARPWRFAQPTPMLRAVPDAEHAARILAAALAGTQRIAVHMPETQPESVASTRPRPALAA